MPEDVGYLIAAIEKELVRFGVDLLYATRVAAPRNTYPYPNIFKDPGKLNMAREFSAERKADENSKIISSEFVITPGLKNRLEELHMEIEEAVKSREKIRARCSYPGSIFKSSRSKLQEFFRDSIN